MMTSAEFVKSVKAFKLPTTMDLGKLFDYMNPWKKYRELAVEFYTGEGMTAIVGIYKEALVALELTDDQLAKLEMAVGKVEALVDPTRFKKDAKSFVTEFSDDNGQLVPAALELLRKFNPAALTEFVRRVNRNVVARAAATEAAKTAATEE